MEPASHSSTVVCEVIAKGSEVSSTVIFIKSKLDCPFNPVAEGALSLTVSAQFKSLLTVATVSQGELIVGFVCVRSPVTTLLNFGMYRFGEVVGANDLAIEPMVLVGPNCALVT